MYTRSASANATGINWNYHYTAYDLNCANTKSILSLPCLLCFKNTLCTCIGLRRLLRAIVNGMYLLLRDKMMNECTCLYAYIYYADAAQS